MSDEVLIVEKDGAVAVLTMNRPKTRNAVNNELLKALVAGLHQVAEDTSVRAVVLTGAGGAFCSGADLKSALAENPNAFQEVGAIIEEYHAIIRSIVGAPKPVIAAVDGCAVGFGCDLALACDMRLLSSRAYLQEKFVKIGLMPDGGGTFWLPRLIGLGRAMEYMMTGEPIDAARALELGLANRVVPEAELAGAALSFARDLAKGPPLAYAEIKRAVRSGLGGTIDTTLEYERAGQIRCLRSGDAMEGVMAWIQKREPTFEGK